MSKNLEARLTKLEDAAGMDELPNGGLMIVVAQNSESQEAALNRHLKLPFYASLSSTRRRKLIPVYCTELDAACL